jgi:hypothetical protein
MPGIFYGRGLFVKGHYDIDNPLSCLLPFWKDNYFVSSL